MLQLLPGRRGGRVPEEASELNEFGRNYSKARSYSTGPWIAILILMELGVHQAEKGQEEARLGIETYATIFGHK